MLRPPSTCRCRWSTDWPAARPMLVTTRNPPATPSSLATSLAAATRLASRSPCWSPSASRLAMCSLGMTRMWVGAWGLTSRKASTSSRSSTTWAGTSLLTILQNRQSGSVTRPPSLLPCPRYQRLGASMVSPSMPSVSAPRSLNGLALHALVVGSQASHGHDLVDQLEAAGEADLDVVVAGPLGQALGGGLDQHRDRPADVVLVEAAAQLVAEGDQLAGPGLLLGVVDLAVHGRGRGVGPLGVAEHVQLGEAGPLDHGQGGGELLAGLAREPDDHVGGQPEAGDLGLGELDPVQELGDAVGAVHGRKHLVITGLEGDVQVAADLGVVADPGHQGRGHLHGQDAGEPQPQQPVDRREPVDEAGQGVGLAPVVAVLAQVDAGEHDLAD